MIEISRFLVVVVLIFLSAHTCSKKDKAISSMIFNHWTHSHEEDGDGIKAYRLSTFEFPISQTRGGFEIKENGEFTKHGISTSNVKTKVLGSWSQIDKNKIVFSFTETGNSDTIEIMLVEKDLLKIKKIKTDLLLQDK